MMAQGEKLKGGLKIAFNREGAVASMAASAIVVSAVAAKTGALLGAAAGPLGVAIGAGVGALVGLVFWKLDDKFFSAGVAQLRAIRYTY